MVVLLLSEENSRLRFGLLSAFGPVLRRRSGLEGSRRDLGERVRQPLLVLGLAEERDRLLEDEFGFFRRHGRGRGRHGWLSVPQWPVVDALRLQPLFVIMRRRYVRSNAHTCDGKSLE